MKQPKKANPRITIYILAFIAVIFVGTGGAFFYFANDFSRNAIGVTGTVIDISVSYSDNSTTYQPTISYVDAQGNKQIGQTFLTSSSYNYPRGSKVYILYDTRTPGDIRIDNWFSLWGLPMVFLGVGLLLAFIAVMVALAAKKRKPEVTWGTIEPKATYGYSSNTPEEKDRAPTVRRR